MHAWTWKRGRRHWQHLQESICQLSKWMVGGCHLSGQNFAQEGVLSKWDVVRWTIVPVIGTTTDNHSFIGSLEMERMPFLINLIQPIWLALRFHKKGLHLLQESYKSYNKSQKKTIHHLNNRFGTIPIRSHKRARVISLVSRWAEWSGHYMWNCTCESRLGQWRVLTVGYF